MLLLAATIAAAPLHASLFLFLSPLLPFGTKRKTRREKRTRRERTVQLFAIACSRITALVTIVAHTVLAHSKSQCTDPVGHNHYQRRVEATWPDQEDIVQVEEGGMIFVHAFLHINFSTSFYHPRISHSMQYMTGTFSFLFLTYSRKHGTPSTNSPRSFECTFSDSYGDGVPFARFLVTFGISHTQDA